MNSINSIKKVITIIILLIAIYFIYGYINKPKEDTVYYPEVTLTTRPNIKGTTCYEYHQLATKDAPYKVDESIKLNVEGSVVSGTKKGSQSGPDMTNGYTGTLTGTLDKEVLNLIFSYTIEGSKNKEQEIYMVTISGLEKQHYRLVEKKGMLVPDTMSHMINTILYSKVAC